ncbi:hypothetical protein [Gordonia terrae]|uniref:hypothetical protein n=1 Tax=Gordonia terrae TaxID=2055 RepID=UPI003F6B5884
MSRLIDLLLGDRRDPRAVLAEEFGVPIPESASPPEAARVWARGVLAAAGVRPEQNRTAAIAVLRREKKLAVRPARYLVDYLAEYHPESDSQ